MKSLLSEFGVEDFDQPLENRFLYAKHLKGDSKMGAVV